jgi:hypothetical protein
MSAFTNDGVIDDVVELVDDYRGACQPEVEKRAETTIKIVLAD